MINVRTMSDNQIRKKGYEILSKKLGAAGLVRFLQQFDKGSGDYTNERHELHKDDTVQCVMARIKKRRDDR